MGKKRRVWWIVGGLATAFALFALTAFLIEYNSPDARIDRAVAQIVEEYRFELAVQTYGGRDAQYSRAPIDERGANDIVAILRSACPTWEYEYIAPDKFEIPTLGGSWMKEHVFTPPKQYAGLTAGIGFIPDDRAHRTPPNDEAVAFLQVLMWERPSIWQRIKGLWPW